MKELLSTSDPVRLSYLQATLADAGIGSVVFDAGAGAIWPGAFPSRLMVDEADASRARWIVETARPADDGAA